MFMLMNEVILVTLFISFYFFLLIIIMFCVFFLLWLTSYDVMLIVYCVQFLLVSGVDVYNVGSPCFVSACFLGTPVCVLHAGCLNDNW